MAVALVERIKEKRVDKSVNKWWNDSNSISVFVSGRTGTGKSTLVNALLGKKSATEGKKLDHQTSEVKSFTEQIQGIDVTVWDSPGLQDGTENESKYLKDIKKKCTGKIDLLLYCISMNNTRCSRDIESMNKLTQTLDPGIWENAVIILTYANDQITHMKQMLADPKDMESLRTMFNKRIEEWKSHIELLDIPILPAGRIELPILLEGHRPWLSYLWLESLAAMKTKAQPALIKMNFSRLIMSSDIQSEDEFKDLLSKQKIIIHDKSSEVGRKMWFTNAERAESAGQVFSTRTQEIQAWQKTFSPILQHSKNNLHGGKISEEMVIALNEVMKLKTSKLSH